MSNTRESILTALALVLATAAYSKDGGTWKDVDPEIRAWFATVMMPDSPTVPCCGEADAYEADIGETDELGNNYAVITGTRGNSLPVGTKLEIPPNKIQWKHGNPTGHVIIFASTIGHVYCFIPNGGV